jgi:transposase InsO family protein
MRKKRQTEDGKHVYKMRQAIAEAPFGIKLDTLLRASIDARMSSMSTTPSPKSRRTFDPQFKREGVELSRKIGIRQAANDLGITESNLRNWKRQVDRHDKDAPPFPDLIQRDFSASEANRRWGGDMTYLRTAEGFEYLATVLDLYSRKVVGWALGHNMEAELVVNALKMACTNRRPSAGGIFHSDRGGQYNSELFNAFCSDHEVAQSMGRTGSCYNNAAAESFVHSLKVEWLHGHKFTTRQAVRTAVFEYIETFHNADRRHSSLGYLSPVAFENVSNRRRPTMQAGTMLHPEAQRSEHRTKTLVPTAALLPQEPVIPNFGNQAASKALSPGTTRVTPSH